MSRVKIGNWWMAAAAVAVLAMAGCTVHSSNKDGNDNVRIATPFGGMHVESNQTTAADVGLPAYPGATIYHDKDNSSANVGMSFGSFHLKVQAVSYETSDPAGKVMDFYRKALAGYGDVLECDHGHAVGQPQVASSGLTCEDDQHGNGHHNFSINGISGDDKQHQLRAGSPRDFRLVELDHASDGQTKFGLVYLELPKGDKEGQTK